MTFIRRLEGTDIKVADEKLGQPAPMPVGRSTLASNTPPTSKVIGLSSQGQMGPRTVVEYFRTSLLPYLLTKGSTLPDTAAGSVGWLSRNW